MQEASPNHIPIAAAALRLAMSYQRVRDAVLRGELRGGRDDYGRLYVEASDVTRYAATVATPKPKGAPVGRPAGRSAGQGRRRRQAR